jgi:hypothetical protein
MFNVSSQATRDWKTAIIEAGSMPWLDRRTATKHHSNMEHRKLKDWTHFSEVI